jgi:UDP-N-acetylmuramoyl-tripeptide--D-alanyl-D-alanine ligase
MITFSVAEAAQILGCNLSGANGQFRGISTDTRALATGELFVALKGPKHDAHDTLAQAIARGAAGAVVSREMSAPIPLIKVTDTRLALGTLAKDWRNRRRIPLVGITGSNGKTTTKEMTAAILRERGPVLATKGNLNNDIGVPLTLFQLNADHHAAVIEMGANGPDDIAILAEIAGPTVGIVTMCGPAHLQGFGSIEKVAQAKGKLLEHLGPAGTAVVNIDDPFADYWRGVSRAGKLSTFGIEGSADYRASEIALGIPGSGAQFKLQTPLGSITIGLPFEGRHNIYNALAASAAAQALGATLDEIRAGLARAQAAHGRLQVRAGIAACAVIDDTYNANPVSLQAALAVLARSPGRRWLVLGDMAELGPDETMHHRAAGRLARQCGVERLFTLGSLAQLAAEAFGEGAEHFERQSDLAEALMRSADSAVTVLVKGSRVMQLDALVEKLTIPEILQC